MFPNPRNHSRTHPHSPHDLNVLRVCIRRLNLYIPPHQRIVSVSIGERSISYVWKGVYIAVTALH
jgi:hypothetical protein